MQYNRSFCERQKSRAEEYLQNLSFFQISNNLDMIPRSHKSAFFNESQFTSWSQADDDSPFSHFRYRRSQMSYHRKSVNLTQKQSPSIKMKMNKSVSFHTNKINLSPKVNYQIAKNKSMIITSMSKMPVDSQKQRQPYGRSLSRVLNKELNQFDEKQLRNPQKLTQLSTQPSYNFISYPISTVMIRKRKFKKLQKCPFPYLALRFNK